MRPRTLDEIVGQDHLLAPGRALRRALEADRVPSMILWGPPGSGKTTLAEVIARATSSTLRRPVGGHRPASPTCARSSTRRAASGQPHDPLHRRDPPLQQGPARRGAAPRRGRHGDADRRDHREPVVRGQRGAALAQSRLRLRRALRRPRSACSSSAPCATPERGLAELNAALDPRRAWRRSSTAPTATRGSRSTVSSWPSRRPRR